MAIYQVFYAARHNNYQLLKIYQVTIYTYKYSKYETDLMIE